MKREDMLLAPYDRREKAIAMMQEAMELLSYEVSLQAAYDQIDFGSLPTSHYKWACKLLGIAIEAMEREQGEYIWKALHKDGV